jgi:hypothetical protein
MQWNREHKALQKDWNKNIKFEYSETNKKWNYTNPFPTNQTTNIHHPTEDFHNSTSISLCIPRVDNNISKQYIFGKIANARFGKIRKITEIPLKNEINYKRVIINLEWNKGDCSIKSTREKLENGETINLVYDMPNYWKIELTK